MNEQQSRENRGSKPGQSEAHPVGTGVGAVAGGAAGAAAGAATGAAVGTAGAGPIGTGIGAAVGAIGGAMAGNRAAGGMNPTSTPGEGRFIDYTVVDRDENKVGTVESVWLDQNGEPAYLAVRSGWLGFGKTHVVPAQSAEVSERRQTIRVPYSTEQIKSAPDFDTSAQLGSADEDRIGTYFAGHGFRREGWFAGETETQGERGQAEMTGQKSIQLKDEELRVGKREVEAGGVRLRKVIRTETVNQPVELKREEIVVERVPAGEGAAAQGDFTEDEIYVPLRREEAVVGKEARVREEVRVGKRQETEKQNISDTVRHEDVEIEKDTGSRLDSTGTRGRTERYQPKERSRS